MAKAFQCASVVRRISSDGKRDYSLSNLVQLPGTGVTGKDWRSCEAKFFKTSHAARYATRISKFFAGIENWEAQFGTN